MAGKIQIGGILMMRNDGTWYYEDEDFEGYRSAPESYTHGVAAYPWLRWRVSPEIPIDRLFEASEVLDEIYEYCREMMSYGESIRMPFRYHLLSFKIQVLVDSDFRGMIREFISLIMPYTTCESKTQVVDTIVYPYLKYRDPENFA